MKLFTVSEKGHTFELAVTLYTAYLGPRMGILVDDDGHARSSGFSPLTVVSGTPPSDKQYRLMDGPGASRPREAPFAVTRHTCRVVSEIIAGSCPTRCQGTQGSLFTDALWETLESCWRNEPGGRPHLRTIFRRLRDAGQPTEPISGLTGIFLRILGPIQSCGERIRCVSFAQLRACG